jgi:hypothetical protein
MFKLLNKKITRKKSGGREERRSRNVSTTPITAMGCRQCLPLSVVQLKGKHCRKPHCRNGVVDTFERRHYLLKCNQGWRKRGGRGVRPPPLRFWQTS